MAAYMTLPVYLDLFISYSIVDICSNMLHCITNFLYTGCRIRGLDLIFVLDSSGSIGADNYELMKQFAIKISSAFVIGPANTQVGVIIFSNGASVEFPLNRYSDEASLHGAIRTIPFINGGTDTAAGLIALENEGFTAAGGIRQIAEAVPRVAIVVTDGFSRSFSGTVAAASSVHATGVIVYAVGVGGFNIVELQAIASAPENVYNVSSFDVQGLRNLEQSLREGACRSKLLHVCLCVYVLFLLMGVG